MKGNEENFLKKVKQYRNLKSLFTKRKENLLHNLKLEKLKSDFKKERVRICFGSKELFHKQFHLEENGITFKHGNKNGKKKELRNLPLSVQKMRLSEINLAPMILRIILEFVCFPKMKKRLVTMLPFRMLNLVTDKKNR